jgi:uncharacterized protein YjiS (DUF1127 family)
MITLTLSNFLHDTPAFLSRIGARIKGLLTGIEEARAMAERFKALSRMSDAELARRGLKRQDIPYAVVGGTRP